MVAQFCDISQFQPEQIDWQAYKSWAANFDGVSRVAMRSSYGIGYKDAHFDAYRQGALAAGIDSIIFYHYAYPQLNNPVSEAKWQKQVVGDIREQDFVVLDFEENTPAATSAWAYMWLAQQEDSYDGKLPGIYASSYYIAQYLQDSRLARYPLWLANWQFTPDERPPVPYPWASYEFVQYTDRATSIPGIPGTVDANIFLGQEPSPPEEQPMSIDLSNGAVANFFSGDSKTWTCKNGFTLHGEILSFYQTCGGSGLCGLTDLGLPQSNEIPVDKNKYPGVVVQEFERGAVRFDPNHVIDNPPAAGRVYKIHYEQDPRTIALEAQITALEQQPSVATLQQINTLAAQIEKLSTVQ